MNNNRRARLTKLEEKFEELKGQLEAMRDEEQEGYDNLPQSLQNGEKGVNMDIARYHLDEDIQSLEETIENIGLAIAIGQ